MSSPPRAGPAIDETSKPVELHETAVLKISRVNFHVLPSRESFYPTLSQTPVPVQHGPVSQGIGEFFHARVEVFVIELRVPVAEDTFDIFAVTRALRNDLVQDEVFGRADPDRP